MLFLYRIFVKCAEFLLPFISIFTGKGKLKDFVEGRKLPYPALDKTRFKRFWFHCASLGEFEQARPVMEKLKAADKHASIVITFFSPSGYLQKHDYPLADAVVYMPLDTSSNAKKFIEHFKPDVAIFVKYEIWYFHLTELFARKIPVYLISSTFRPKQFLFSSLGRWLFDLLPRYEMIFLQDEKSHQLLKDKGLENIRMSGDTRYDRVKQNALQVKADELVRTFKGNHKLLILGSSWPAEEDILLEYLNANPAHPFKIVIAPHDIHTSHINEITKKFEKYHPFLYTNPNEKKDSSIMILNTMGHLASTYYYADITFVGGAFRKGLHNILEPLAFGAPVIFGPNYDKYPEAAKAMASEVAISVKDVKGFANAVTVFSNQNRMEKCIDFINWNSGASDKVVKAIKSNLGE